MVQGAVERLREPTGRLFLSNAAAPHETSRFCFSMPVSRGSFQFRKSPADKEVWNRTSKIQQVLPDVRITIMRGVRSPGCSCYYPEYQVYQMWAG